MAQEETVGRMPCCTRKTSREKRYILRRGRERHDEEGPVRGRKRIKRKPLSHRFAKKRGRTKAGGRP